ncbi:MAG: glutathione S-transferase [Alphaproteobacteria bacterium]|nr:glutathione S-transferase [Alphaproteobacteria bacterium]
MKLYHSPASPYVRKVMAVAIEAGLDGKIERINAAVSPVAADAAVSASNPLGKVPTLVTDDGLALYDSPVICEYLDSLGKGAKTFPAGGAARWLALQQQALGDGLLDAAILWRYESVLRPKELQWSKWSDGQMLKIDGSLAAIEAAVPGFGSRVDIGTITCGCALGYLDFRFADKDWRKGHPKAAAWFAKFDERPSMKATRPIDPNAKK